MLWKSCSPFPFLSLFAGLKKGSGWDDVLSFGSLWKILSEGVEDGVGRPARFTLHHWQSHIPGKEDHSRVGKDKQSDSKISKLLGMGVAFRNVQEEEMEETHRCQWKWAGKMGSTMKRSSFLKIPGNTVLSDKFFPF